jgi:hypothetical protein
MIFNFLYQLNLKYDLIFFMYYFITDLLIYLDFFNVYIFHIFLDLL